MLRLNDPIGLERQALIAEHLLPQVVAALNRQYQDQPEPPQAELLDATDWLITNQPDEVERFQPAHDCARCRAGNDQARAFPGRAPAPLCGPGQPHLPGGLALTLLIWYCRWVLPARGSWSGLPVQGSPAAAATHPDHHHDP